MASDIFLLEGLDVVVYATEFTRDADMLGAVGYAGIAGDAMVGLAYAFDRLVIGGQVYLLQLLEVLLLGALRDVTVIDTAVVVLEDGRDVDAVRAGHAILVPQPPSGNPSPRRSTA